MAATIICGLNLAPSPRPPPQLRPLKQQQQPKQLQQPKQQQQPRQRQQLRARERPANVRKWNGRERKRRKWFTEEKRRATGATLSDRQFWTIRNFIRIFAKVPIPDSSCFRGDTAESTFSTVWQTDQSHSQCTTMKEHTSCVTNTLASTDPREVRWLSSTIKRMSEHRMRHGPRKPETAWRKTSFSCPSTVCPAVSTRRKKPNASIYLPESCRPAFQMIKIGRSALPRRKMRDFNILAVLKMIPDVRNDRTWAWGLTSTFLKLFRTSGILFIRMTSDNHTITDFNTVQCTGIPIIFDTKF